MASKNPHPHVAWREGRPRFVPANALREKGYQGTDLRHPEGARIAPADLQPGTKNTGAWFTKGEAVDWSVALVANLDGKPPRSDPARQVSPTAPRIRHQHSYTVEKLFDDWFKSPKFREKDVAASTAKDYRSKSNAICEDAPSIWGAEVDALDRVIIYGLYEDLRSTRGLSMSRGVIRVLSSAISWGLNRGKFRILKENPALRLHMKTPKPRVRFATRTELLTLVAIADAVGLPEIGDCFILAVWTGQRQGDRLTLTYKGRTNKRIVFKQSKTGEIVAIQEAPQLLERLQAASARRKSANVVDPNVILFERTWLPFQSDTYKHIYSDLRRIAIHGLWLDDEGTLTCPVDTKFKHVPNVSASAPRGTCVSEPCGSLEGFWESDFRDTAVTWMALAGATIPEIISVTGHSAESATQILRHYLARHPEMADSAIDKMVAWYDGGGETEIGF